MVFFLGEGKLGGCVFQGFGFVKIYYFYWVIIGFDLVIYVVFYQFMKWFWVYIFVSYKNGMFYIGVINDLVCRLYEYQQQCGLFFMSRYGVKRFVWYEEFVSLEQVIVCEKVIKYWFCVWKIDLIEFLNFEWFDFGKFLNC